MPDVTIRWGSLLPKEERLVTTYTFHTQEEVSAFLTGIAEMDGWMGYAVVADDEEEDEEQS